MTIEYKGHTITVDDDVKDYDNGDWYFHVPAVDVIPTIKALCKQTGGWERITVIDGVDHIILSCRKPRFLPIWIYEKKTQGDMTYITEYFDNL